MAHDSAPDDLVLHGARVLGFATPSRIAGRYRLDTAAVEDTLLDVEAVGWARFTSFGGSSGWSLTEAGRAEGERRLAAELDLVGARELVTATHAAFLPLNRRFGSACTDWQIRPGSDPMAFNDHTDFRWDERILQTFASIDRSFRRLCEPLGAELTRFGRYPDLFGSALAKVETGQRGWVDGHDRDCLHLVWIQFHEDLLATLGIPRGSDAG